MARWICVGCELQISQAYRRYVKKAASSRRRKGVRQPLRDIVRHCRLCSKNSVNATSVTKSEISRFRSRRPLPPDPYCSAPTQPPPLAAAWPWQVIGKNAKLHRRRDTFVSEISEFRHRRRDSYSIFTDVLSRRASIEPAGALSIEPAGAYVPDSLPGYMIASSA